MQDGEKLYLVIVCTISNLSWLICSAVIYGNPFKPIIEIYKKVVKRVE